MDGWTDGRDASRAMDMYVCAYEYIYELFWASCKPKS